LLISNDMTTYKHSLKVESIEKPYFVWFENNWVHDDILHKHKKAQLIYVDSGFQYLTVADKKYVVPQYHAAWIPSDAMHKTNTHSAYIKLSCRLRLTIWQMYVKIHNYLCHIN